MIKRNNKRILVSIIIPTKNRFTQLVKCIKSINSQIFRNYEIIIIDNNSRDNLSEKLRELFPSVRVKINKKNIGPSKARNQGINLANGKYCWFLVSDSFVHNKRCLNSMVKIMDNSKNIGSIGGELFITQKNIKLMKIKKLNIDGSTRTLFFKPNKAKLIKCDYLATCNCFIRKKLLQDIGGFDPDYFCYSEDAELGIKIKKKRLFNISDIRTSVIHDINESEKRNLYLKFRN